MGAPTKRVSVMYRVFTAGLGFALVAAAMPANASSLTVLPAVEKSGTPSVIHLGAPATEERIAEPEVVAAPAEAPKPAWMAQALPVLIRGGEPADSQADSPSDSPLP